MIPVAVDDAIRWLDTGAFLGVAILVFATRPWDARATIGLAMALAGFVLWMLARSQLGASFSVTAQARKLVTHGIYSRVRHPIYWCGEFAYLGLAVAWGHWVGYLYIVLTCALQLGRIKKEEAVLESAFGEEYRRYKARTWF